jgi:hypothetical protein
LTSSPGVIKDGWVKNAVIASSIALALSGCASPLASRATLVASTLALAADWSQTREMTDRGWTESNPFMGEHPPGHVVDMYFVSVAALNAIVYLAMPSRWKWVVPAAVLAVETKVAIDNDKGGARFLGR